MRERSVIEILVLMFTFVVGLCIVGLGGAVAVIEIRDPAVDTTDAVIALGGLISTILGALLGLLAGRTQFTNEMTHRPSEDDE